MNAWTFRTFSIEGPDRHGGFRPRWTNLTEHDALGLALRVTAPGPNRQEEAVRIMVHEAHGLRTFDAVYAIVADGKWL